MCRADGAGQLVVGGADHLAGAQPRIAGGRVVGGSLASPAAEADRLGQGVAAQPVGPVQSGGDRTGRLQPGHVGGLGVGSTTTRRVVGGGADLCGLLVRCPAAGTRGTAVPAWQPLEDGVLSKWVCPGTPRRWATTRHVLSGHPNESADRSTRVYPRLAWPAGLAAQPDAKDRGTAQLRPPGGMLGHPGVVVDGGGGRWPYPLPSARQRFTFCPATRRSSLSLAVGVRVASTWVDPPRRWRGGTST